jgi:hypothetical protein
MGRFRNGKCIGLSTPDPECIFGKVKPANDWWGGYSNLVKPGNERAQLLYLDDVEGAGVLIGCHCSDLCGKKWHHKQMC